jgi:hypothetical protein
VAIDIKVPQSPGWWLKRAADKLEVNRKRIVPLFERYEGKAQMPRELANAPEPAQRFYKTARTNLAEMIVKAPRYRLRVTSILTSATADDSGDQAVFDRWRAAGADAEQDDVHRNALICGYGYMLGAEYEGKPAVTSEDPRQVVAFHDPVRQSRIRAAAKFFHDDELGVDYAYLYLRDKDGDGGTRFVAKRNRKTSTDGAPRFGGTGWDWDTERGGEAGESFPLFPLVPYLNEEGVGEFERHIDLLNRFDHLVLQGLVIATLQAFKQRAIKAPSKDLPEHDEKTGERIDYNDVFLADPGALWLLPETADLWESGVVDLTPITNMATKQLEWVAAVMFTPMSMFTPEAANQSAQGASLVKEGLTSKVQDKQHRWSESHAQTVALIAAIAGDIPQADDPWKVQIRWAPAERYSLPEKADAAQKAKAAGMPFASIMREVWQADPADIARMETERAQDATLALVTAPPAAE